MMFFELSRIGFGVEGKHLFNPYTQKYFTIKKISESEAKVKFYNRDELSSAIRPPTDLGSLEHCFSRSLVIR